MLSRVKGILKKKAHLYKGLPILEKEEFYNWSRQNKDFNKIYKSYVNSGFELRKAPSIDRIDADQGYLLENMRWITFSENCIRGSKSKKRAGVKRCRRSRTKL